jgi:hypothetical protein
VAFFVYFIRLCAALFVVHSSLYCRLLVLDGNWAALEKWVTNRLSSGADCFVLKRIIYKHSIVSNLLNGKNIKKKNCKKWEENNLD